MGYTNCNESAMSLGANLINVQRLGLRLTVSFESYKHDLEETKSLSSYRGLSQIQSCGLLCGLGLELSHRIILNVIRLEAVFEPQAKNLGT